MKRLVFVLLITLACGVTPAPAPAPVAPANPLAYDALCAKSQELTAAQWDAYFATAKGETVTWAGPVSEVDKFTSGQYYAWLDLGEPYRKMDAQVDLPPDVALALVKGQVITVTGQLDFFAPQTCIAHLVNGSLK